MTISSGGFFHFSGEYGLAADNVKNFEVPASLSSKLLLADSSGRLYLQMVQSRMQTQSKTVIFSLL